MTIKRPKADRISVRTLEADTLTAAELNLLDGAGAVVASGTPAAAIADHADPATATAEEIATKQNTILAALRTFGIVASE